MRRSPSIRSAARSSWGRARICRRSTCGSPWRPAAPRHPASLSDARCIGTLRRPFSWAAGARLRRRAKSATPTCTWWRRGSRHDRSAQSCHTDDDPVRDGHTLDEALACLEATLEATHDGILLIDLAGRIVAHNRQFLRMFRVTSDDLVSRGVDELLAMLRDQFEDDDGAVAARTDIWSDPPQEKSGTVRFTDGR